MALGPHASICPRREAALCGDQNQSMVDSLPLYGWFQSESSIPQFCFVLNGGKGKMFLMPYIKLDPEIELRERGVIK